jgi:hypothetical protein
VSNLQPQSDAAVCAECGRRLGKDGKCFLYPKHEQRTLALVDTEPKPEVEVETAEQLSLSEELFERYEVETVTVSVSGGCDVQADMLGMFAAEGLEPGMDVVITCRGHVKDVSTPYKVKDRKCSGRLVLGVEVVESVREVRRG